ncbi:hypothetical protein D3C84_405230 [compost metagenome]
MEHVARDIAAHQLSEQGVDQLLEAGHRQRRALPVQVDILQASGVDAIAYAHRGDVQVVVVDEVVPGRRRGIGQGIAIAAGLLIGVAVADEHHLVVVAVQWLVDSHGFFDTGGEIGVAAERPRAALGGVDGGDLCGEGIEVADHRVGSRGGGEDHHLQLDVARGAIEQRLASRTHGAEHLVQFGVADAAAEVQHEHQVEVLALPLLHADLVVLRIRRVIHGDHVDPRFGHIGVAAAVVDHYRQLALGGVWRVAAVGVADGLDGRLVVGLAGRAEESDGDLSGHTGIHRTGNAAGQTAQRQQVTRLGIGQHYGGRLDMAVVHVRHQGIQVGDGDRRTSLGEAGPVVGTGGAAAVVAVQVQHRFVVDRVDLDGDGRLVAVERAIADLVLEAGVGVAEFVGIRHEPELAGADIGDGHLGADAQGHAIELQQPLGR